MESKWSNSVRRRVLLTGITLCVVLVTKPTSAIETYTDSELLIQNGTMGVIRCTFDSSEVVRSFASVTWSFQSSEPDSKLYKSPYVIFHYSNGKGYPGSTQFQDRVQFIGDINKRDVSIQLNPAHFSDNGTFYCDVKNPPDVTGTPARTELRVVPKESIPITLIIGIACGVLLLLVLIAVAACVAMRVLHNRHDYEGCTSLESMSSQAPQPPKKVESGVEGSKSTIPLGPLQGPVIYAQLDHSGSKNSFHKMEPVVYADIRKN